jgi:hypothetical protein
MGTANQAMKRVTLNVAVLYTGSYFAKDDRGTIAKARKVLDSYNIDMRIWPENGQKSGGNMLSDITWSIPHDEKVYKALRARVDAMVRGGSGFSVYAPALFTQFDHRGYGITPEWFKTVTRGCLVGPTGNSDEMDLLHELGHCAGCDHEHGDHTRSNLMNEADGRSEISNDQLNKFLSAAFAVA